MFAFLRKVLASTAVAAPLLLSACNASDLAGYFDTSDTGGGTGGRAPDERAGAEGRASSTLWTGGSTTGCIFPSPPDGPYEDTNHGAGGVRTHLRF